MKRRILVCGGRNYTNQKELFKILNSLTEYFDTEFCIIQGGARGADLLAYDWACFEGCAKMQMDADWETYGDAAGRIRNKWMIKFGQPDLVIAFPGGSGTANMVRLAKKHGIDVYEPL